jgi:hypothetical protein
MIKKNVTYFSFLLFILILSSCSVYAFRDIPQYCDFSTTADVVEKSDFIFVGKVKKNGKSKEFDLFYEIDISYIIKFKNYNGETIKVALLNDYKKTFMINKFNKELVGKYYLFIGSNAIIEHKGYSTIYIWHELPSFDPSKSLTEQDEITLNEYMKYIDLL